MPDPYWLCRCDGWRVLSPAGRVGTVVRALYGSHLDVPEALLVRCGLFRRRLLVIAAGEVASVNPQGEALTLTGDPRPSQLPAILTNRAHVRS